MDLSSWVVTRTEEVVRHLLSLTGNMREIDVLGIMTAAIGKNDGALHALSTLEFVSKFNPSETSRTEALGIIEQYELSESSMMDNIDDVADLLIQNWVYELLQFAGWVLIGVERAKLGPLEADSVEINERDEANEVEASDEPWEEPREQGE